MNSAGISHTAKRIFRHPRMGYEEEVAIKAGQTAQPQTGCCLDRDCPAVACLRRSSGDAEHRAD